MNTKKKPAWVSGNKIAGYKIHIAINLGADDFLPIQSCAFPNYKGAQTIANAINDYAADKKAKGEL